MAFSSVSQIAVELQAQLRLMLQLLFLAGDLGPDFVILALRQIKLIVALLMVQPQPFNGSISGALGGHLFFKTGFVTGNL